MDAQRKEASLRNVFQLAQGSHQAISECEVGIKHQQETWETEDKD